MNCHRVSVLLLVLFAISLARGELLPPPVVGIGSSADAHFLVRLDDKIQLFALSKDEKSYRLVTEIDSYGSVMKGLVSKDGVHVITFENANSSKEVGAFICLYSASGDRLSKWPIDEIINKSDLAKHSSSKGGSVWWQHEVGIGGNPEEVFVVGPTEPDSPDTKRYLYTLDLKSRVWKKRW